jgi:predicted choloylglycine hydrolase
VNQNYTIQSVIFNTTSKQVHLATGQVSAAHTFFRTFSLFGEQEARVDKAAILARNLDWPWGFLAPYTILVRTHSDGEKRGFVNVTFPGFIGVLTGMNDQGVALACCQSGQNRQTPGEPVTLLFRRVLEHAATADEAGLLLGSGDTISASSMNLVVVAPDRAFAVELDPARRRQGSAAIHFAV